MKKLSEYRKEGYQGIDVSLETSLYEYGMIWKRDGEEFRFVYGVGFEDEEYNLFDWSYVAPIDANPRQGWDWVDWEAVAAFVGVVSVEAFLLQEPPLIVFDLISYYGTENVFGGSYEPFEIEDK